MASGPDQAQEVGEALYSIDIIIVALFHTHNNVMHCDARKLLARLLSVQNEMLMRV